MEQQMEWNVMPVGYNARGAGQLIEQLMGQERVLLIDTRKKPTSIRPEWRQGALRTKYGNRYRWAGQYLGNANFDNGGPIEIVDPATGLRGLRMYLSEGYRLIILCGCHDYARCHRQVIVEMLCASTPGVRVMEPELPAAGKKRFMQTEWEPQEGKLCCLSIKQPYCNAIIEGRKCIELRPWGTSYRGLIAIHAGLECVGGITLGKPASKSQIREMLDEITRLGCPSQKMRDYPTGAIIGVARLVQCRRFVSQQEYESLRPAHLGSTEWDERDYGWHFVDVVKLPEPIKTRGYLGLFGVDREPLEDVLRQFAEVE